MPDSPDPVSPVAGITRKESLPSGLEVVDPDRPDRDSGFSFGVFRLEADGALFRGDKPVHLPPRELAALQFLLAHAGQIVTPLQLKQALWGDVHVTADSIPKCLSSLRARLQPEECIQTVYKRGYRFSSKVLPLGEALAVALPRLAITPFAALYGVPEHLGMAIAEETITRFTRARHPAVSILARDSVFTLALRGLNAQQIGETLKADLVLTGSLRTLPAHFRLRAEMILVQQGTQIWVEDLLVDRSRFAGLESELVNRLAFRLFTAGVPGAFPGSQDAGSVSLRGCDLPPQPATRRSALPRTESTRFPSSRDWNDGGLSISASAEPFVERRKRTGRREAYEIYQRGHHEWQTLQRHRMQDGMQLLSRAIELDPSLIAARVDLVNLCIALSFYGFMSPAVAADLVRRTAELGPASGVHGKRALLPGAVATGLGRWSEISIPDLPPGAEAILPALGWISFHVDHDLPAALHAFSVTAHLPHEPWITRLRVMFALSRHRFDEAIGLLRDALQLDPYSPSLHARLAWALHLASQAGESVECIHRTLALFPEDEISQLYATVILAFNGDAPRAIQLAQNLAQRSPHFDIASAVHAYALACSGRDDEARTILERLQWLSRERFVLSSFTPAVHVVLGNHHAALSELRAAADARCPWFFQMLADPRLNPLHSHPEFNELRSIFTRMEEAAENPASEF
jgi:TolB-like protein/tetratricopeptide (TPR) repeat protein